MLANPLDMRGPDFLLFYLCFSVAVIAVAHLIRRKLESGTEQQVEELSSRVGQDPYAMAFLRGGKLMALQVAVVSLLERGLLIAKGSKLEAHSAEDLKRVRRPLDTALLTHFGKSREGRTLFEDDVVLSEAEAVGEPLKRLGLAVSAETLGMRLVVGLSAAGFLIALSGAKIAVALSRGRTNVQFLIVLTVAAVCVLCSVLSRGQTVLGRQVFKKLEAHFKGLKQRRLPERGSSGEVTFLAAVFGMSLLPPTIAQAVTPIRPPAASAGSGWSASSCSGSSCGSSSSCGGSSCGGGGGCGGCGG